MASNLKKGILITFEGPEGSGKSTQSKLLYKFLKTQGYKVLYFREPGTTKLGERIRDILLNSKNIKISYESEMFLYVAARAQLVSQMIIPALKKGKTVICDRFADATLVYQGYGLDVDKNMINKLNNFATRGITPDITFVLDVQPHTGLERSKKRKGFRDRIEKRALLFHRRVRAGYLEIAKTDPRRLKVFSAQKETIEFTQKLIQKAALTRIFRACAKSRQRKIRLEPAPL